MPKNPTFPFNQERITDSRTDIFIQLYPKKIKKRKNNNKSQMKNHQIRLTIDKANPFSAQITKLIENPNEKFRQK